MKNVNKIIFSVLFFLIFLIENGHALRPDFFQVDEEIKKRAEFWKKIYTIVSSDQGFLHDPNDLNVVYEMVSLTGLSPKAQSKHLKLRKEKIKNILLSISYKNKENLNEEESQYYLAVAYKRADEIREMAENIRWQRGMSDRFRQGLIDSELYIEEIKKIFKEEGVPEELSYLPHVESSFNYRAYSKVGAAGIWQFMRSTARLFRLKMSYVVDERLDPLVAGRAAAKLLKSNYAKLGAWPLAITAYNHGPHGMERAARSLSTTNISEIIKNYEGSRFGFASQNFYACFVAAYELSQSPEKYFGSVAKSPPFKFNTLELERPMTIKQISALTGANPETLKIYNRAIRPVAFNSRVPIPKNTIINLPLEISKNINDLKQKVIAAKEEKGPDSISETLEHLVSQGDSLYIIAKNYKVSMNDLIEANHLENPQSIKVGDKLKIPVSSPQPSAPSIAPMAPLVADLARLPIEKKEPDLTSILEKENKLVTPLNLAFTTPSLPDDVTKTYKLEVKKISNGVHSLTVEANESLGQYAEWLNVSVLEINKINRIGKRFVLRIGQKLKIPLKVDGVYEFNLKRVQYHLALEEDFYSNFKITEVEMYKVRRGDTLLAISEKKQIPLWLMKKYIPLNQQSIRLGQVVTLPKIVPLDVSKSIPLDESTAEN